MVEHSTCLCGCTAVNGRQHKGKRVKSKERFWNLTRVSWSYQGSKEWSYTICTKQSKALWPVLKREEGEVLQCKYKHSIIINGNNAIFSCRKEPQVFNFFYYDFYGKTMTYLGLRYKLPIHTIFLLRFCVCEKLKLTLTWFQKKRAFLQLSLYVKRHKSSEEGGREKRDRETETERESFP